MIKRSHNNLNNRPSNQPDTSWDSLTDTYDQLRPEEIKRRELVSYYLSGGDINRVIGFGQSDTQLAKNDEAAVRTMIRNGEIPGDSQRRLLESIDGPLTPDSRIPRGVQIQRVLDNIGRTPVNNTILQYLTNFDPTKQHKVNLSDIDYFYNTHPTPIDFEKKANQFLYRINTSTPQGENTFQMYNNAMHNIALKMYGKKQEYYDQMKQLEDDAFTEERAIAERQYTEHYARHQNTELRTPKNGVSAEKIMPKRHFKESGDKVVGVFNNQNSFNKNMNPAPNKPSNRFEQRPPRVETAAEHYSLVKSVGNFSMNKTEAKINAGRSVNNNEMQRRNEDASYANPEKGLFGVFDGMGGHIGGADASESAKQVLSHIAENYTIRTQNDLRSIMHEMSNVVRNVTNGDGGTTAVVGQIVKDQAGNKHLIYTWAGDSRIYLIRDGKAHQITNDEGFGRFVTNYLGVPSNKEKPAQTNAVSLKDGDRLLFCSDGITGDVEKDFIPNQEMVGIIKNANSTQEAAQKLAERATKIDDRTAIVVEV